MSKEKNQEQMCKYLLILKMKYKTKSKEVPQKSFMYTKRRRATLISLFLLLFIWWFIIKKMYLILYLLLYTQKKTVVYIIIIYVIISIDFCYEWNSFWCALLWMRQENLRLYTQILYMLYYICMIKYYTKYL